jgi:8-oxo-dGTP pyrophosphatase MutT (NUDIX family)
MTVICASAVIIRRFGLFEDRVLLEQRPAEEDFPFVWGNPGGLVESGESEQVALQRELDEELAIQVGIGDIEPLGWKASINDESFAPENRRDVEVRFFRVHLDQSRKPRSMEGQGFGWFAAEELVTMAPLLLPGTRMVLGKLHRLLLRVRT